MKIGLKKLLFYLAWTLYLFNYVIFEQSQFKNLIKSGSISYILKLTTVALLLACVFYRRSISKKLLFVSGAIISLVILAFIAADTWTVLFWGLFAIAATSQVKYREFLKYDLKIRCFLYVAVLILVLAGVLNNESHSVYGNVKSTLGYTHYNMFGMNMAIIIIEMIALYRDTKKKRMYLGILMLCIVQVILGVGRTGLYASVFITAISIVMENKKVAEFIRKHCKIFSITPLVLCLISYILSYLYDKSNNVMSILNKLSSTRIAFAKQFLDNYHLSLFGQKIYINNNSAIGPYSALDMGYIRVGLEYGLLILVILIVFHYRLQKKALHSSNIGLYLSSYYFCLALVSATSVMNIANNWILVFTVIFVTNSSSIYNYTFEVNNE